MAEILLCNHPLRSDSIASIRGIRSDHITGSIEFVGGYDTVNVMAALTCPKLTNKLKNSPLAALEADAKSLEKVYYSVRSYCGNTNS